MKIVRAGATFRGTKAGLKSHVHRAFKPIVG